MAVLPYLLNKNLCNRHFSHVLNLKFDRHVTCNMACRIDRNGTVFFKKERKTLKFNAKLDYFLLCKGCEQVNKTIEHYLQECPACEEQCAKFKKAVHQELESIAKVLSDPKMLPHLFKYITGTQRFAEQYSDLSYSNPDNG